MPQFTIAALNGLLFLLPGLVALRIGELISHAREEESFSRLISALLLTLLAIAVYTPITIIQGMEFPILSITESTSTPATTEIKSAPVATLVAPDPWAMGALIGISVPLGGAYALFLKVGARPTLWTTAFRNVQAKNQLWIQVHLKDGTQIIGWPRWYNGEEIFIADAEIFDQHGELLGEAKGRGGILLSQRTEIQLITFVDT